MKLVNMQHLKCCGLFLEGSNPSRTTITSTLDAADSLKGVY
jgi:hypothetical protein